MNVLIIGGSSFLGPHLVRSLRQRDHAVTLFNRGRSSQDAPQGVQTVVGDRERDMSLLAGRRFDAAIDTCGFVPRIVRLSAQALAQSVTHYTFISTMSVYADPLCGNRAEEAPLATIGDPTVEEILNDTYGPLKALCENEVAVAMAERSLIVRPGLIVGPLDPTDRFTYWPHRFALGGDVLVPGDREHPISYIDVRDLAEWIVRSIERRRTGAFNASGDYSNLTMGRLVDACIAAAGSDARPVWADEAFIAANGVEPWSELPVWLPTGGDSLMTASSAKAVEAGLTYRPVLDTVSATLEWTRSQGLDRPLKAGLTRARELQLLAAYREQM